ncbi:hypothetical protein Ccrd_017013 [Cynara cardunculus var. scolymus]|uniref:Uncharacterized protein n=1 Tax=Cynara cardunculus var. scolymus TaxID=59895 RepID=A0A118K2P8_CYNCS|nr:hypothetical protein Ccrd_017013 [Cynara cardunculus var. scolymus]
MANSRECNPDGRIKVAINTGCNFQAYSSPAQPSFQPKPFPNGFLLFRIEEQLHKSNSQNRRIFANYLQHRLRRIVANDGPANPQILVVSESHDLRQLSTGYDSLENVVTRITPSSSHSEPNQPNQIQILLNDSFRIKNGFCDKNRRFLGRLTTTLVKLESN